MPRALLAWSRSYQDPFACFDHGDDLTTDRHGNVYVTGTTVLSGPSPSNGRTVAETAYVTIKYDRDGHRKWLARYQGDARKTDQAKVVAVNDEGDVYVTGVSQGETHPEIANFYHTIKLHCRQFQSTVSVPRFTLDSCYEVALPVHAFSRIRRDKPLRSANKSENSLSDLGLTFVSYSARSSFSISHLSRAQPWTEIHRFQLKLGKDC